MTNNSDSQPYNRRKTCREDDDIISKLPDDILLTILSKLDIKETARTSILSKTWRIYGPIIQVLLILIFLILLQIYLVINRCPISAHLFAIKKKTCSDLVHHILSQHQAPAINELRINFKRTRSLDYFFLIELKHKIWINIAIQKKVETLLLDFRANHLHVQPLPCLPLQSFGSSSFTSLVSLTLICVRISSEFIDYLLATSPLLQVLSIRYAGSGLSHMKVCGRYLRLKHLDLRNNSIDNLEILSAPNLESFKHGVYRDKGMVHLNNVPSLTNVSFAGWYGFSTFRKYQQNVSNKLPPQLESLEFNLTNINNPENFLPIPVMTNVKQIQLKIGHTISSYKLCFSWLEACPFLNNATLNLKYHTTSKTGLCLTGLVEFEKHRSLKLVKVVDYKESGNNEELVSHLPRFAPSLEKMTIVPHNYESNIRERARKLKVAQFLKLEIL